MRRSLRRHPDRCFVSYLLFGLIHGFMAGLYYVPLHSFSSPNLLSAINEPDTVDTLLAREVEKGYMIGPYDQLPFSVSRINPIGVATRKYSGKKRLIIDMSAPRRGPIQSVNDLIPKENFSLAYASVDHAIKLITITGRGAWLAKADIVDAFKVMPLHPSQWHLFCVEWKGKFFFSVRLTFGCRSSPCIFNSLSEALCWILLNVDKLPFVLHLLDDFLLVDFPSPLPSRCLRTLTRTFTRLGVPLSEEKTIGPSQRLEFLGITLDSTLMQASLPLDKLNRIREFLRSFLNRVSITKRELLLLLGHLNFAMRILPQGRSFIARLLVISKSTNDLNGVMRGVAPTCVFGLSCVNTGMEFHSFISINPFLQLSFVFLRTLHLRWVSAVYLGTNGSRQYGRLRYFCSPNLTNPPPYSKCTLSLSPVCYGAGDGLKNRLSSCATIPQ